VRALPLPLCCHRDLPLLLPLLLHHAPLLLVLLLLVMSRMALEMVLWQVV